MKRNYSVTYKVASMGSRYIYQEDKAKHKAGDEHASSGGHMWYVLSDGHQQQSYGFESKYGEMRGKGNVTTFDDAAYQQTAAEFTIKLTEDQYNRLLDFSKSPEIAGFDATRYRLLTNSCVDFAFKSLEVIGYNRSDYQGRLVPASNIQLLHNMLKYQGAQIIRDNLTRHGEYYEEDGLPACLWLSPEERLSPPNDKSSLIHIDIDPSPQPQRHIQDENQARQDVANGYIQNSATHKIVASGDILNKTDFVASQMASLATGGVRPGEMQLDLNVRPASYLADYYLTPDAVNHDYSFHNPDFSLQNAATLNGLSAMSTFNTYVDPLLLDLDGEGVHMTDIRNGVLFDTDHSGTLKRSGWADRRTGMLVIDDGSGQVKDISRMFSEYYGGKAGVNGMAGEAKYRNGFAALASKDANRDGVIDRDDPIWNKLRVWVDSSHDGQVNAGELKTLAGLGIDQISLHFSDTDDIREGNRVVASGTFTINGKTQQALAVEFLGDPVSNQLNAEGKGTRVVSTIDGTTTTAYASQSDSGETLNAGVLGVNNLYGGSGDDTLIAADSGSWLVGGAGSNTYIGGSGDDVFVISASDDAGNIHGNGGHDTAIIVGNRGVELNMAAAGLTLAEGGSGDDIIRSGGQKGVFIKGGAGNSLLVGGMGNDVLVGGSGHNTIVGGSGNAVIYAGPQGDTIYASERGSVIHAGGGDDKIFGGYGDDVIEAGHGNATIDGDGGINLVTLHGNHGEYQINRTDSGYQITDKVAGRDGSMTLKNIQKLNFADISAVDLQTSAAMPVSDVLTRDKSGNAFDRTRSHLIAAESLLANDQRLNSQGDLHIAGVGDATGGEVSLTAQGDVLFTPDAQHTGLLSFKYGVADAAGNISASVMDLNSGQTAPMRAGVTLLTPEVPLDPLAANQWYLSDANILPVWKDFTGKGVRIGQFEPGGQFATAPEIFDIAHPDLAASVDKAWLQAERENGTLPELVSNHATMVAGVMVAAKNNSGSVGVAYDASLGGYYLANDGADLAGLGHMVNFDIANNSWGFTEDFALSNFPDGSVDTAASLGLNAQYAAANGRGGLGTVIVAAGGNARATGGNAQGSLTSNNRFSVQVGAINARGDLSTLQIGSAPFSNPGASLLVSAPGSNVVSTSHMLETDRGSTFGDDYSTMQGTSFAAPIVSGIVALMLEANPNLGYRDVQQILALSAHKINDPGTDWQDNGSHNWNGGGMHTSNDYGFGEVDARAAVRLSEAWMTQSTADNEYVYSASGGLSGKKLTAGETLSSSVLMNAGLNVEHLEIDFDADVGRLGDLTLKLISPQGTESLLMNRQGKIPDGSPGAGASDMGSSRSGSFKYSFMSTHDFGESSAGNWTLELSDAASGQPVTLNGWALRLYGSKSSPDDTYFYTDEYIEAVVAQAGRMELDDTVNGTAGGRNTLNAAAVSYATSVNLLSGEATIGGAALTIKHPGDIQNIITGDGDDTLIAGSEDALLDGGRGSNRLTGGTGKDFFIVHRREAGSDVISNFEAARGEVIDLIGFAGKNFDDLLLTQQGHDVNVGLGNGQSITLKNQQADGLSADNFLFQQSLTAPISYTSSDAEALHPQEGLGTVILNGGGKGVMLSSNAQGQLTFDLNGTVYRHDRAPSDIFVVAAQPGVSNYKNALRGFRHGVDKIDLRQTGITDFSQLKIEQTNRGTINGLSQIHGLDVILKNDGGAGQDVNLLYLDTLEISQIAATDFLFAQPSPDKVAPVPSVSMQDDINPSVEPAGWEPQPVNVDPFERHPLPDIDSDIFDIEPVKFDPIKVEPVRIRHIDFSHPIPEWRPLTPDTSEKKPGETIPTQRDDAGALTLDRSFASTDLGEGDNTVIVSAFSNKVVAGNGNNNITVTGSFSDITLGNGNNQLDGDFNKLTVGDGDNLVHNTGYSREIVFGNGDNNITDSQSSKITVGDGNNVIHSEGSSTTITGGDGNNAITGSGTFAKINSGHGDNIIRSSGSMAKICLGNGDNDIIDSGTMSEVTTRNGNNIITSSGDMSTVSVGDGDNDITISGSMSDLMVGHGVNDVEFNGDMGTLYFGSDIRPDSLWFQQQGPDLQISVTGSGQQVNLHNWYASEHERPSRIVSGDNNTLFDSDVERLVQAMASFAAPASAHSTFFDAARQNPEPVLAANWH